MPNNFKVGGNDLDAGYVGSNEVTTIYLGTNLLYENETQLETPQNVTAENLTVSWDEVENAQTYSVRAEGTEIGTVSGTS